MKEEAEFYKAEKGPNPIRALHYQNPHSGRQPKGLYGSTKVVTCFWAAVANRQWCSVQDSGPQSLCWCCKLASEDYRGQGGEVLPRVVVVNVIFIIFIAFK